MWGLIRSEHARFASFVPTLHTLLVDAAPIAMAIHVAANVYESLHQRENLIGAMVTGRKRKAPPA